MTDITITSITDRFGGTFWVLTWGKGITQTRIASSYEGIMMTDIREREAAGVKVLFDSAGTVLGTAESGYGGEYLFNEYRTIPLGATRRDDLRGLSAKELTAAGWLFIS